MDSRLTRREFLSRTGVSLAFLAGTFWRKHNVLAAQSETIKLKLAYPPSMCSLPVVLGQERNLFENHGLDLKLTATEGNSDGAMLVAQGGSGGANCCITDLTSSILAYTRGGQQLSVAYQIFLPSREERYLGLISSSQSEITTMKQLLRTLDEAPKNSIVLEMDSDVHYVTDRLLESQDVQVQQNKYYLPGSNLVRVMMNLLMGEFMAAVLPEPLLTLALKNPLFGEGRGNLLSSYPETDLLPNVVVFNNQFLNRHPDAVNRFAKAWAAAAQETNEASKSLLLKHTMNIIAATMPGMEGTLKETTLPKDFEEMFSLPHFHPPDTLPSKDYRSLTGWLSARELVSEPPVFEELTLSSARIN